MQPQTQDSPQQQVTVQQVGQSTTHRVQQTYERLRAAQQATPFPSADARVDALERLERGVRRHRDALVAAANADFGGRASMETLGADILLTLEGVRDARRHVTSWMKPRVVRASWISWPARAYVQHLPKGVVGILSPWNYPVNLALAPLAGALAAGNRAVIKPSEQTPAVSQALADLVADCFAADEVDVLLGGPDVAKAVTHLPLDHILFTGSTQVGRLVARAAAENLTPVTLELGGKSPTLVHADYPMAKAAERIAMGKLYNGAQTCIAPDYVLLPAGKEEQFRRAFVSTVERSYPSAGSNPDYTALITNAAVKRMEALLADAEQKGARVERLGPAPQPGQPRRYPPVLVWNVDDNMKVMQEEIFGPLLPVVSYSSLDEAVAFIARRPHPLAFYYFDDNQPRVDDVLSRVTSGGACINDCLMHFTQENLPFGGIGHSGMGAYHGRTGFETFSHARSVLQPLPNPLKALQDPPYGKLLARAMDMLIGR